MHIYWTLKHIPELAYAPRSERGRRWRAAYRRTFRHWQTWAGLGACAACAGAAADIGQLLHPQFPGLMIAAGIGGGIGGFVFSQAAIRVARRHYRNELLGIGSENPD